MSVSILSHYITIIPNSLIIRTRNGIYKYDVQNFDADADGISSNPKVCFQGVIHDGNDNCVCSSSYFPVELFYNKKEGDVVPLMINNIKYYAKCSQNSYRKNDKFENTLLKLSASFGGICDKNYFNPSINKFIQRQMMIDVHNNLKI